MRAVVCNGRRRDGWRVGPSLLHQIVRTRALLSLESQVPDSIASPGNQARRGLDVTTATRRWLVRPRASHRPQLVQPLPMAFHSPHLRDSVFAESAELLYPSAAPNVAFPFGAF